MQKTKETFFTQIVFETIQTTIFFSVDLVWHELIFALWFQTKCGIMFIIFSTCMKYLVPNQSYSMLYIRVASKFSVSADISVCVQNSQCKMTHKGNKENVKKAL